MSTMTVTSKIDYRYLKNKTKDEIISLLNWILDIKCVYESEVKELSKFIRENSNTVPENISKIITKYEEDKEW